MRRPVLVPIGIFLQCGVDKSTSEVGTVDLETSCICDEFLRLRPGEIVEETSSRQQIRHLEPIAQLGKLRHLLFGGAGKGCASQDMV